MDQHSKDALGVWAATILGGVGGWWGTARLAATYGNPIGTGALVAGALAGAAAGAVLGKLLLSDPSVLPEME